MSSKKQSKGGLAAGLIMIIIALVLVALIFMELCTVVWWNPLSWPGYLMCLGVEGIAKLVMGIGALILFFGGIWKIVRS